MEFSPDGRYIAFGTGDVRPPFTYEVFPDEASVENGRKHDTDLYIATPDGKLISKTTWKNYLCGMAVSCPIWYLQWRGNGESLYAGDAEGIKHIDIHGNVLTEFLGRAIGLYEQSGELYTSKDNTIVVKNLEGKKIREFRTKSYDPEAPFITRITEIKKLAAEYSAVFDRERIQIKSRGEKEPDTIVLRNTEVDKNFELTDVSIHPDGNFIALGGKISGKSSAISKPLIYIIDTEGKIVHQYIDFIKDRYIGMYVEELNTIKFSASGQKLIGINGISKLLQDELQKTRHSGFILNIDTGEKQYFRCSSLSKIVLHPVEAYFAVDMGFGDICIYDYQGNRIALLQRKERDLENFFFSTKGRYLFTDSGNGVLEVFDLETENILTAAAFKDGEWFLADGRGRFDCSAGGFENVRFVKGTKVYEPEQFWDSFFTPGLLSKFTGVVTHPEDELEGEEDAASPAEIAAAAEYIPYVTMEIGPRQKDVRTAAVTVTAEEGANGIGKIFLVHNGRVVEENSRGLDKIREAESVTFSLPLVEGENIVQGGAYDKDGTVYGTSRSVTLSYEPAKVIPPDMYVLSVGVGDYHDTGMTLGAPDDDARAIAALFPEMADDLYGEVRTMLFINEEAEKDAVEQALTDIIQQVETRDTVIIFFAGHGYVDRDIYYFLPYDTDITDMESTAVDIGTLSAFLRDLPANKVALFLDTCQSGSAVKTLGTVAMSRSIDEKRQIANLAKARGIAVFSASSSTQKAYEIPELNHGLFTHSILTALEKRKNEVSIRGKVALGKLLSTVNRMTRDTAYEYLGIEQSPSVYIFGDDFYIGEVE
jgi:WD40 repeat protein